MGYRIRYGVHRTKFCWLLPMLMILGAAAVAWDYEALARYVGGCIREHIG